VVVSHTLLKLKCSCLAVVVSLRDIYHDQNRRAPARDFREPPSLAEWTNAVRSPITTNFHGPMGHFLAAVESSIRAASPLTSSTPSGCWLSALIEMQIASSAELWDTRFSWDDNLLRKLSLVRSSLESDRHVIMRVEERVADVRRSDYALAFSRLEQLLEEARSEKTNLEEELNNQYRTSSVKEARNAVSCEFPNIQTPYVRSSIDDANEIVLHSYCLGFCLHSDQPGFLDIRHERAANQPDGMSKLALRHKTNGCLDI
jgi:hypothetical protein